jgi:guanosine-3',5'-bis(diphosphate) 3'-pyrophosphohydrolase
LPARRSRRSSASRLPRSPYAAPDFGTGSLLVARAYVCAFSAHEGSRGRGTTGIEHPAAVAALLAGMGADEQLVAAALLHDILEDTDMTCDAVRSAFGFRIADLVYGVSEDRSIQPCGERKAYLRRQVVDAGIDAVAICLAEQFARVREFELRGIAISPLRLAHYRKTLELVAPSYPHAPFLAELSESLRRAGPGGAVR